MLPQSGLWFEIISRNASTLQIIEFFSYCLTSEHFDTLSDLDKSSFTFLNRLIVDSLYVRSPDDMLYSFIQHEITKYGFMKNEK